MKRLEDLPDLPPLTAFLLIALVLAFWLAARIRILRRRQTHRPDGPAVEAWGWLYTLAARPWILPALLGVAALLAAAVVVSFVG